MTPADAEDVAAVVRAANDAADRRAGREPETLTAEQRSRFLAGMHRFTQRDPDGAFVATDGDTVVGMAESIRRDDFWGLAMLFVHPDVQSKGIGHALLTATMPYAEGARVRMILTSPDPRALRRYSRAGLAIHPAVEASGVIDPACVPADLPGRAGDENDLDLVADVDAGLRGSRAEDVQFLVGIGYALDVVDSPSARGYIVHRPGNVTMLGATDEDTAAALLWRALAAAPGKTEIWGMTAAQDWAVKVALAAHMKVVGGGPLFIDGLAHPPGPWLPSGWYF